MSPAASPSPRSGPVIVGRILLYADDLVARWMTLKTGQEIVPPYTAFATVAADGQISGAVLFNDLQEASVELSMVATRPLSRALLRLASQYAFGDLRCRRVTARTRASNLPVRRFIEKAGFKQEGVLRSYYPDGDDAILYGLLKSECRW